MYKLSDAKGGMNLKNAVFQVASQAIYIYDTHNP